MPILGKKRHGKAKKADEFGRLKYMEDGKMKSVPINRDNYHMLYNSEVYDDLLRRYENKEKLPKGILKAVMMQEGANVALISEKGAGGIMQIMPETEKDLASPRHKLYGRSRYDIEDAPEMAARLLSDALKRNRGSVKRALIDYHGGDGTVKRYNAKKEDPRSLGPKTRQYVFGDAGVNEKGEKYGLDHTANWYKNYVAAKKKDTFDFSEEEVSRRVTDKLFSKKPRVPYSKRLDPPKPEDESVSRVPQSEQMHIKPEELYDKPIYTDFKYNQQPSKMSGKDILEQPEGGAGMQLEQPASPSYPSRDPAAAYDFEPGIPKSGTPEIAPAAAGIPYALQPTPEYGNAALPQAIRPKTQLEQSLQFNANQPVQMDAPAPKGYGMEYAPVGGGPLSYGDSSGMSYPASPAPALRTEIPTTGFGPTMAYENFLTPQEKTAMKQQGLSLAPMPGTNKMSLGQGGKTPQPMQSMQSDSMLTQEGADSIAPTSPALGNAMTPMEAQPTQQDQNTDGTFSDLFGPGTDLQKEGLLTNAATVSALADRETSIHQRHQDFLKYDPEMDKLNKMRSAALDDADKAYNDYRGAVDEFKKVKAVDPNRFWKDQAAKGWWQSGIAVMLGAIGQTLTKSNVNMGIQALEAAQARDLEAQKLEFDKYGKHVDLANNVYSLAYRRVGNVNDAMQVVKAMKLEELESELKMYASMAKTPQALADVQIKLGQLQNQKIAQDTLLKAVLAERNLKSKVIRAAGPILSEMDKLRIASGAEVKDIFKEKIDKQSDLSKKLYDEELVHPLYPNEKARVKPGHQEKYMSEMYRIKKIKSFASQLKDLYKRKIGKTGIEATFSTDEGQRAKSLAANIYREYAKERGANLTKMEEKLLQDLTVNPAAIFTLKDPVLAVDLIGSSSDSELENLESTYNQSYVNKKKNLVPLEE
jgi:hypothetical protein